MADIGLPLPGFETIGPGAIGYSEGPERDRDPRLFTRQTAE